MALLSIEPEVMRGRLQPLVARWRAGANVTGVRPLEGGASSLTYLADVAGAGEVEQFVVKVAPPGLAPVRNRDVLRQARLFAAIKGAPGVAVPEAYFTDAGAPPEVPPLFAMTYAPGESFEPVGRAPAEYRPPDVVEARVRAAAKMLAALHRIDRAAAGLGDEPVVTLRDEIDRWARALETVEPQFHPRSDELRDGLIARMPEPVTPRILHADFRLGNLQCEGTRINAIIDWEIWSISDPRIDLGWFVMFTSTKFWTGANGDAPGMPDHFAIEAEYEKEAGMRLRDMHWFHALIRFKQAAVVGLLDKRVREPGAPAEPGGGKAGLLIQHGLELLEGRGL